MILPKRDSGTLRRRPCAIKILKSLCPRHGKKKFAEDSSQNQTGNPSPELLCFPDDKAQLTPLPHLEPPLMTWKIVSNFMHSLRLISHKQSHGIELKW